MSGPAIAPVVVGLQIAKATRLDMRPVGAWWRPYFYGPKADAKRLIEEEVRAVREGVGVLDVSTLGGLEVRKVPGVLDQHPLKAPAKRLVAARIVKPRPERGIPLAPD